MHTVKDDLDDVVVSPPIKEKLYFFCSCLIDLIINFILFLLKFFLDPENEINIYLGFTPLEIISDIDDLITFLIIRSGLLKLG